jgi:hypothetical protein
MDTAERCCNRAQFTLDRKNHQSLDVLVFFNCPLRRQSSVELVAVPRQQTESSGTSSKAHLTN